MNMGEGKTSCILPMALSQLADGTALARVVVPKAWLIQTGQLLHMRLGGLLGRKLCHIPFSRRTATDVKTTKKYHVLHNYIRRNSGVILALPEHLLSFKLSGLQQMADGKINEARAMMDVQLRLEQNSRDVIDEVDELLAIRTQVWHMLLFHLVSLKPGVC